MGIIKMLPSFCRRNPQGVLIKRNNDILLHEGLHEILSLMWRLRIDLFNSNSREIWKGKL